MTAAPDPRRALGILIDALVDAAFRDGNLDGQEAQDALDRAGLLVKRPATAEDIEEAEYGDCMEVGDEWCELTAFASECRRIAKVGCGE